MNHDEIEFTKNWWKHCTANPEKLNQWLKKLQLTEIGGYYDYQRAFEQFGDSIPERTKLIFTNIGLDEQKHSSLLLDLFKGRRIIPVGLREEGYSSLYWTTMNRSIVDLDTFCAVNYYGEGLAAFRFEVLHDHPDTPSDVKEFISKALPDETFHRETLKRLSSEETLASIGLIHEQALAELKRS